MNQKIKTGQRWKNVTRHQIIEIIATDEKYSWYRIIEQDSEIAKIKDFQKSNEQINHCYTLIA